MRMDKRKQKYWNLKKYVESEREDKVKRNTRSGRGKKSIGWEKGVVDVGEVKGGRWEGGGGGEGCKI